MPYRFPWERESKKIKKTPSAEEVRQSFIADLCNFILPPFNFTRKLGVPLFDDQSLRDDALKIFDNFVQGEVTFTSDPYEGVYRALADSYKIQRDEFCRNESLGDELLRNEFFRKNFLQRRDQKRYKYGEFSKKLFFDPQRANGAKLSKDEELRNDIATQIESSKTFEQYLNFRKSLYETQLLPELFGMERIPYSELYLHQKYEERM